MIEYVCKTCGCYFGSIEKMVDHISVSSCKNPLIKNLHVIGIAEGEWRDST